MKKVVIMQRRLTHYRLPLFESMRESLASANVELVLYYGMPGPGEDLKGDSADLPWAHRVDNSYFSFSGKSFCWQPLSKIHLQADLVIIPQEVSFVSAFVILIIRMILGRRTALWGHGANLNLNARSSLGEAIKRMMSRRVSWWFAYTSMTLRIVTAIGYPASRVTVLNNSIDTEALKRDLAAVPGSRCVAVRAELDLSLGHTAIFLGSLYAEKRIDILLEAADLLYKADPLFRLLIVGDGPLRELVREFCEQRAWCHWLGARTGAEKALFLVAADVMLCPGLVGLVVLDAFVAGLPLVTMANVSHPPEAEYLVAGANCEITSPELQEYVRSVRKLMTDSDHRHALAQACLAAAETYTVANMADRFSQGIVSALS